MQFSPQGVVIETNAKNIRSSLAVISLYMKMSPCCYFTPFEIKSKGKVSPPPRPLGFWIYIYMYVYIYSSLNLYKVIIYEISYEESGRWIKMSGCLCDRYAQQTSTNTSFQPTWSLLDHGLKRMTMTGLANPGFGQTDFISLSVRDSKVRLYPPTGALAGITNVKSCLIRLKKKGRMK